MAFSGAGSSSDAIRGDDLQPERRQTALRSYLDVSFSVCGRIPDTRFRRQPATGRHATVQHTATGDAFGTQKDLPVDGITPTSFSQTDPLLGVGSRFAMGAVSRLGTAYSHQTRAIRSLRHEHLGLLIRWDTRCRFAQIEPE